MKIAHTLVALGRRLRALTRGRHVDQDVEDELAFHLAMREADYAGSGNPPRDPAQAARRRFGNVTAIKEQTREMWTFPSLESFRQDARYALRGLRKSPGFAVVTILVLAIGIGANTAIFSLVDALLLRGLPFRDPGQLVVLIGNVQRAAVERRGGSYPDFLDWRARTTRFEDMAVYSTFTTTIVAGDEPGRVTVETVSAAYFPLLGIAPARGRAFRPDEDQVPNRDAVVILSDGLWARRFGRDEGVVGRGVQLGARTYQVIGIAPPGFTGLSDQAEVWMPYLVSGSSFDNRGSRGFQVIARLKPGTSIESARAELTTVSRQLEQAYPDTNAKRGVEVSPLSVELVGQLAPSVLALMAAVAFVLLIACANVANLLISRSEVRQKEIAVRTALGAGQARLIRQLVTESCVLTSLGALGGLAIAEGALRLLTVSAPIALPTFARPGLNVPVLAFTLGVALVCGVIVGLAPATHARVSRLGDVLKASRGSSGVRSQRLRNGLVIAEVSLAIVLLVGASLLIRSVQTLAAIDPGFDPSSVLTLNLNIPRVPAARPATPPAPGTPAAPAPPPPPLVVPGALVLERVRAVPGVVTAAFTSDLPLSGNSSAVFYTAEGDTTSDAQTMPRAYGHRVTPEFFATMRMTLRAGRSFTASEATADSPAVIVSEGVVRRFWSGHDGIGRRIKIGGPSSPNPWLTIVGVAPEVKYRGLPQNPTADPDLYLPFLDRTTAGLVIQTSVPPASVGAAVRAALRATHSSVVVYDIAPLTDLVNAQTAASRFTTWLMSVFAAAALLLAVIGIYGVMSYLVAQRSREFGIRLALGATRREIVSVVLWQGAKLVAIGAVVGLAAAVSLTQVFARLLFNVRAVDVSSGLAVLLLVGVALLACVVPAVRATRVDPALALRNE